MYNYYLFDLDGTITQSEFGIIDSAVYALEKFNIKVEDRSSLKRFIGPPLFVTFHELYGFSEQDAEQAVVYFREFYNREGIYNAPLYDGVKETLEKLKAQGKKLAIATSKPKPLADVVIKHSGLWETFDAVIGPTLEKKKVEKRDQILDALSALHVPEEGYGEALMVGDRHYDIDAARDVGIDSVGVMYGYGSEEELTQAGATFLVQDIRELLLCNHP